MKIKGSPVENSPSASEILLYTTQDGKQRIEVRLENGTVWLSQKMLSELFQVTVPTINEHIKNIYEEGELPAQATIRQFLIVQHEGVRQISRQVDFYNLEIILAIGYRVRSHRGTQVRQWATERLSEYMVKGFTMDDERLAEPGGGIDYFDELLERIRAVRASEKRFYQKIRDIYLTSADYDPKNPMTQEFFATVQNKMLFAATGKTAAELIHDRADAALPNMGLTTWKGAGRGRVLTREDAGVAKNYLNQDESGTLELLVGQYLDFAELQAKRRKTMHMRDWIKKLDSFLSLNEQDILRGAGKISADLARDLAGSEYAKFEINRRKIESDQADEEIKNAVKKLVEGKKHGGSHENVG